MRHSSGLGPLPQIMLILFVGIALITFAINLFTYALIAAGILLFAGMLFVIVYSGYWLVRSRVSPVVRIQASVVRRRKKGWDVGIVGRSEIAELGMMGNQRDEAWKAYSHEMRRGNVPEIDLAAGSNYFVTFAVNGQETEFSVPEEYYIKCSEGAVGLLVYRGEEFMHFIPDVS